MDKQTEIDLARPDNFISNFEPLTSEQVRERRVAKVVDFEKFTRPMKRLLKAAARQEGGYAVSSDSPRIVDGKPSLNPRYLQDRPDLVDPMKRYVAARWARGSLAIPAKFGVPTPVDCVLLGRRNPPNARPAFAALPSIIRSIIRNCPNCSWISSAL